MRSGPGGTPQTGYFSLGHVTAMWTHFCNCTIDKQEEEILHASECAQRGKWPLDSVGKYVFVSVYIHLSWVDVVWERMFGERQTSAAQTHKYLGQNEEEGLPQACDKMQAC